MFRGLGGFGFRVEGRRVVGFSFLGLMGVYGRSVECRRVEGSSGLGSSGFGAHDWFL